MADNLAGLYAAVYAAPDHDAPRQVLADALLELGDPRGEFIALQLARAPHPSAAPSERERELERRHGDDWAAPLSSYGAVTLERGFPGWMMFDERSADLPALGSEWSTLRAIVNLDWLDDRDCAALAELPALREVTGRDEHVRAMLDGPRAWTYLGIHGELTAGMLDTLPQLRRLSWASMTSRLDPDLVARLPLRFLRLASDRLDSDHPIDLPTTIESLVIEMTERLPRLSFDGYPNLGSLTLIGPGPWPARLRPSIEHLLIDSKTSSLPELVVPDDSRLHTASLSGALISCAALAPFAHVRELIVVTPLLEHRALEPLREVRELQLSAAGHHDLGHMTQLTRLRVLSPEMPRIFDVMSLRELICFEAPLEQVTTLAPLRSLAGVLTRFEDVAALVRSYDQLEELTLWVRGRTVDDAEVAAIADVVQPTRILALTVGTRRLRRASAADAFADA